MHDRRLVLFPRDAHASTPDVSALIKELTTAGFVEGESRHRQGAYMPGHRFMSLITFLGCSPKVSMGDDIANESNRYYIEVPAPTEAITVIRDAREISARCPGCGSRQSLSGSVSVEVAMVCSQCGFSAPPYEWNWRHRVGFGRVWINVWGVHEGEAVPGEELLQRLEKLTGFAWNYAWCHEKR